MNRPRPSVCAAELCVFVNLSPGARELLEPTLCSHAFFERLLVHECYGDAVRFLPHALPSRRAIWWGCLCAWDLMAAVGGAESERAALDAALAWVLQPSEELRRAAETPARTATLQSPAGCLAQAAFWSGGSMVGPHLPMVPSSSHATPRLVGGAVLRSAIRREPLRALDHYRRYLAMGQDIARGRNLWTDSATRTPSPLESNTDVALNRETDKLTVGMA